MAGNFLSDRQYERAALWEAIENEVPGEVARYAWAKARDARAFDRNIQSAIHAEEWLLEITFGKKSRI